MVLSKWLKENQYRTFGGKKYRFHGAGRTKTDAERVAKIIRNRGDYARVVNLKSEGKDYAVYMRKQ